VIKSELQYIKKYRIGGVEYQTGVGYRTAPHRIAKPAKIPMGIPIGAEAYCRYSWRRVVRWPASAYYCLCGRIRTPHANGGRRNSTDSDDVIKTGPEIFGLGRGQGPGARRTSQEALYEAVLPNTADALGAAEAKRVHQVNQTGLKSRSAPGSWRPVCAIVGGQHRRRSAAPRRDSEQFRSAPRT
jgi:hypothetical protein